MRMIKFTAIHKGLKYGAGRHDVEIRPAKGTLVAVSAGPLMQVVLPKQAVGWLNKRGCPRKLAAKLVKMA